MKLGLFGTLSGLFELGILVLLRYMYHSGQFPDHWEIPLVIVSVMIIILGGISLLLGFLILVTSLEKRDSTCGLNSISQK